MPVFAETVYEAEGETEYVGEEEELPFDIVNNPYFLESVRLAELAEQAFSAADYEGSTRYAEEAIRFALLSDEFIAQLLRERGTEPQVLAEGARNDTVVDGGVAPTPAPAAYPGAVSPLPATYTVRPWARYRDSLWTIAGYPWVYGNPHLWRVLFNANRARMPQPDNPDLIEPGFVLEIPSLQGEHREGAWDPAKTYRPLN